VVSGGPPPTFFGNPKKYGGKIYFMKSNKIFLKDFLPYPPKYSRVKGGGSKELSTIYAVEGGYSK